METKTKPMEEITGYEEGTFPCYGMEGCYYCKDNRCIYHISQIQRPYERACNDESYWGDYQ